MCHTWEAWLTIKFASFLFASVFYMEVSFWVWWVEAWSLFDRRFGWGDLEFVWGCEGAFLGTDIASGWGILVGLCLFES